MTKRFKYKQYKKLLKKKKDEELKENIALLKAMEERTGEYTDIDAFLNRLKKRIELLTSKNDSR